MVIRELAIANCWEIIPTQWKDDRGVFLESFRADHLEAATGGSFVLRQSNISVSNRGVLRGIHFADVPPGQAKYVTVTSGAGLDFVVDIRVGSPTFGQWESVLLDTVERKALYLTEGIGHAFLSLTDGTILSYLVSETYNPPAEHSINPLDPQIALKFPAESGPIVMSPKDQEAPFFADLVAAGTLPRWDAVKAFRAAEGL